MKSKAVLSAGVVVVRERTGRPLYLLLRAYNYWDFPKGVVEPGEAPQDAARREVREETGLTDLEFRWGPAYRETLPYGRGKVARYYLACAPDGEVTLPINPVLGRAEHHEFRWVDYNAAMALLGPRQRTILKWAGNVITGGCPDSSKDSDDARL